MAAYTAIDDPEAHFQVVLYTGDGNDDRDITLPGDTDMQPDFVWIKERSSTSGHQLTDSLRGVGKHLSTVDATAEGTNAERVQVFNSDGFQIGTDSSVNQNTITHVAWCWKANGTGSSNTSGSINTTATSANTTSGFSIITYTGNGSNGATIGHGLGAVPAFIVCKERSSDAAWTVFHHNNTAAPETDHLNISNTDATADNVDRMNDTMPTSTLITLGTSATVNGNTETYVNYVWTGIQGFSKFGSYTGNGNADGTFIYTGFRPAYVLTKATGATENWSSFDNKRLGYNPNNYSQDVNVAIVERTTEDIDILSNGFKLRQTNSRFNTSGGTYIYAAFAEAPFVNSNGVPCNAR